MIHTVKVAKVTDPKTGIQVTASFDDRGQIIFISYGEMYFESEAYHLETWCKVRGYELIIKEFELEI